MKRGQAAYEIFVHTLRKARLDEAQARLDAGQLGSTVIDLHIVPWDDLPEVEREAWRVLESLCDPNLIDRTLGKD